ncbi:ABC transporter ATP-binding protein [Azotosporobacter soli]|uniref:ABC transporter ATP-binding protein n=1 Tax=Azotosporobacter soli TaxID=3055040 RepID=UPI0031FF1835
MLFYWNLFIRPYCSLIMTALAGFVIASLAGLSAPLVIRRLIDDALMKNSLSLLHGIIGVIVGLYVIRGLFSFLHGYLIAKAGNQMVTTQRLELFKKLQAKDYAFFVNVPAGEIISLFTNDLLLVQQAVMLALPDLLVESLNLLLILGIMIYFDWQLALVTFAVLPFIVLAIKGFNKRIATLGTMVEDALSRLTGSLHEALSTIPVIQSYVRQEYECEKFNRDVQKAQGDLMRVQRLNALLLSLVEFLAAIGLTVIIWYGGYQVISGHLSMGGMFAFLIYIINIPVPLKKISMAMSRLKLGEVAWQRLERLGEGNENGVSDGPQELLNVTPQSVSFESVSFAYQPEVPTLSNISLLAKPGEMIAIVGPSGAGKSSFANLLLRFYDPVHGAILYNGVDIRQFRVANWRRQIGFIQQEPILFNTTILDNIRYGSPQATEEEVRAAARMANADEFIARLPGEYQYVVGDLGGNLSGGQRQRIAIARAVLLNPAILVLDEPTAALDPQAEKQVLETLRQVSGARITFMITHRLNTLQASDRVLYMEHGRILEQGTHAELMLHSVQYAKAVHEGAPG